MKRLVAAIIVSCFFQGITSAAEIKAGPGTENPSLSKTIQKALPGDVIMLSPGICRESEIIIDKPLSIRAQPGAILDVEEKGSGITIRSNFVNIEGLEIRNIGISYLKDNAAIRLEQVSHCMIRNNRVINGYFGIFLADCDSMEVSGNTVTGMAKDETSGGNAIHLWQCSEITLKDNYVSGHRDGIYFEFVKHSRISRNTSENNLRYGLHFMFSDNDSYIGNTFRGNGAGVAVMYSRQITMKHNHFTRNWGPASYGLLLKDITDSEIVNNRFERNTIGIFAEGSLRLKVASNLFYGNGWGVKVMGSCENVAFSLNNFINNTFEVTTNTHSNSSFSFSGNYWSNYSGYDLNHDGTGDVPHRPAKLFSYVSEKVPESIVLLRSMFMGLLEVAEKLAPVLTPVSLQDESPSMKPLKFN